MKRREEKDIIWHIIRYIKTLESLHCYIDDLRTFEKCKNDYEYAYNQLRSKNISAKSIQVAIRYCQLQYHQGLCDYQITRDNIKLITDWENYTPDYYSIVLESIQNFKTYWDDALNSYKRTAPKIKRIQYLIERLGADAHRPYISENITLLSKVISLQTGYQDLLESIQNK